MRKKTIKIPIYQCTLTMIYDKDLSYVQKKYKTISLENYGAVSLRNESYFKEYVVAFEYCSGSIISHEIVHLKNYIFKDCGLLPDIDNDEAEAYLTGWLFTQIASFLGLE